ncbi:sugar transferase [Halodurantibacterium flavum]|uniref:Sugar transferase n=1 Tax=Halodurantibacterium flavum TaxID=1382802 RepID=A0ABW4S9I3_9RHOB
MSRLADPAGLPLELAAAPVHRPAIAGFYRRHGKRCLDLLLVVGALPFLLPVVLLLAMMVRMGGGPAFYAQPRVGRGGRLFHCWKLRTMHPDAEAMLADHLRHDPQAAADWTARQKLVSDPRITRLGAILRRFSLDELPQIWNVLRGDMSLIGPRPFTPAQRALYHSAQAKLMAQPHPADPPYYRMRPGLTGAWQVGPRQDSSFADRAPYDAQYWETLSLGADLRILLQTVGVVLRGRGT